MATFRKDNRTGEWKVFGTADEVAPGSVSVRKSDGTSKTVQVDRVSKPFDVNGVLHVYGYIAASTAASTSTGSCCAECGAPSSRMTMCSDSNGIQGPCCPRCARMSRFERSFA